MRLRQAVHNFFQTEDTKGISIEDILWRQARSMDYNPTLKSCYGKFWEQIGKTLYPQRIFDIIAYIKVSGAQLPRRPLRSIWHRLRTMYHPSRVTSETAKGNIGVRAKNEAWNSGLDQTLLSLVPLHGHSWLVISEHLGRTPQSCKDRYSRLLRSGQGRSWTKNDDIVLIARLAELAFEYFEDIDWEALRSTKWPDFTTAWLKEKVEELILTVPSTHSGSLAGKSVFHLPNYS